MKRKRSKANLAEKAIGLQSPTTAQACDFFSNLAARTGYGSSSLENYTEYPLVRFTLNYWALVSIFESSWIARRIVEAPAQDVLRAWPSITSDMKPDDLVRLDRAIRRTNTRDKVLEAVTWARLFGGAGALIAIKGHENQLDQPLDLESIELGAYKGLLIFDRWSGISPLGDVCADIDRPLEFGHAEFYEARAKGGESFKVHATRIIRFSGPRVPEPENSAYSDWGISVLAPVIQTIQAFDNVSNNALSLSFRANILGMRMPDLAQLLSGVGSNQQASAKFEQRMESVNHMISNQSLVVLPQDGELSSTQYSFSGLSDLMQNFQLQISGAAKMPMTRLWGKTATGLSDSGTGDERIYAESIATEANTTLRPAIDKLLPVICMSELGEVPDDMNLNFPNINVPDEKDKSELAKTVMDTVVVALNSGLISPRSAARELKQASTKTDLFTNLTDEDIARLSDEVQSEGELGESLFGEGSGGLNPTSSPKKVMSETSKQAEAEEESMAGLKALATDAAPEDQYDRALERYADLLEQYGRMDPRTQAAKHELERLGQQRRGAQGRDADGPAVGPERLVHGLKIVIETPKGYQRHGDGWSITLPYDYGYFKGILGADGDSLDVALGPNPGSMWVYVLDQCILGNRKKFDEHKVFLGYDSQTDALAAFRAGHHRAKDVLMDWTPMPVEDFKHWLATTDLTKPCSPDVRYIK